MPRVRQSYRSPFGEIGRPESRVTKVPVKTEREWIRRIGLRPASLTAEICGDPLPGYSALDRTNREAKIKKVLKIVAVASLVGGCVSALGTASALLPLITTSIDAACASSQALAQQAQVQPPLAGSSKLAKVNAKIAAVCGVVDPASVEAGNALHSLNTATAELLGQAGALGVQLRGLK